MDSRRMGFSSCNTEKAMAPHSSTLAWKIPCAEEPGRLQSMGSLRVRHNCVTSLSLFLSCIGEGRGNPLQCSCLENPRDGGAWWAAVYGWHRVGHEWSDLAAAYNSEIAILVINSGKGNLSLHTGFTVHNSCTHKFVAQTEKKKKSPQILSSRWMDKSWCIHVIEYHSEWKGKKVSIHQQVCIDFKKCQMN